MRNKKSLQSSRMSIAMALIVAAFLASFLIATILNKGDDFWVVANPISPGKVISNSDLKVQNFKLDGSEHLYMKKNSKPSGMIATRLLKRGEVLAFSDLTSVVNAMSTSAIPISVRTVDISSGLSVGEEVDIYWVSDSRNGEEVIDPILVLGGVVLLSYDDSEKNFGSDVALTVAVEETQVLRMLSATTQGRLVVVRSHV